MDDGEYYDEFMQEIYARSSADKDFYQVTFTERMCSFLVENAVIPNFDLAAFKKDELGIRVDAWNINTGMQELLLFVTDFRPEPQLRSLTQGDIEKLLKRAEKFFTKCKTPKFYESMEEATEGYGIAREIYENIGSISRVRIFLLSNGGLSNRVKLPPEKKDGAQILSYDIWDINRLARIELSGQPSEEMIIEFKDYINAGVPCLPAFTGSDSLKSYLLVMPGGLIAALYDKYGERLLEQNVRTFLQFRGDVNKGIRNTIKNQPDMFFAYNNGLSAAAESVTVTNGNIMTSVKNLQIVNGGQTTASLFATMRKEKADLSRVYVQVKLSVIPGELVEDVIPQISEFANTQNKVNAADFFSNHPFHKRIESFSRRLWAPSAGGSLAETHWFYERARGQYANVQAKMTDAQQRKFLLQNPKSQMFTKTDLAKYVHTMEMLPHTVSKGAQFNFAQFAATIGKQWGQNENQFNELYFKRLIAKAILFKSLDQQVMGQSWYGGYKANIVTYTLAKFAQLVAAADRYIDYVSIWKKQGLSSAMEAQLLAIASLINDKITDTELNVTQYCKQEVCWQRVEEMKISLSKELRAELLECEANQEEEIHAVRDQKMLKGIEAQVYVVERGAKYWNSIILWGGDTKALTENDHGFLAVAARIPAQIPTEKQCERILEIERRAIKEGFFVDD